MLYQTTVKNLSEYLNFPIIYDKIILQHNNIIKAGYQAELFILRFSKIILSNLTNEYVWINYEDAIQWSEEK